jgi:hypothetical protein
MHEKAGTEDRIRQEHWPTDITNYSVCLSILTKNRDLVVPSIPYMPFFVFRKNLKIGKGSPSTYLCAGITLHVSVSLLGLIIANSLFLQWKLDCYSFAYERKACKSAKFDLPLSKMLFTMENRLKFIGQKLMNLILYLTNLPRETDELLICKFVDTTLSGPLPTW